MTAARAGGRALAMLLLLGPAGCGYALVGRGTNVDPSIKRIGVPLFRDQSGKPGLDQKITQRVIEELLKRGRFDVVQSAASVDAVVDGEIASYTVTPVGFEATGSTGTQTQASRYAIQVVARVRYSKTGEENPIWSNEAFSFRDEYDIGDAATFFDREEQTIERLSQSFARNLVAAMLEAF